MMRVGVANNRHPAEIVQMTQAEFDVMPEGDSVHTLKVCALGTVVTGAANAAPLATKTSVESV